MSTKTKQLKSKPISNPKIRIAFLLDFFPYPESKDGATKILANILNRISEDFEVTVICSSEESSEGMPKRHKFHSAPMSASGRTRRFNKLSFIPESALSTNQIKNLVEQFNLMDFDIIHTALHTFFRLSKVHPNVYYGINDSLSRSQLDGTLKGKLKSTYFRMVERKINRCSAKPIVVSENDAAYYNKARTLIMPNGVDDSTFYPTAQTRIENSFVFHGVLDYQVNIDAIVEMSRTLKELSPNYQLHLVGRMNRPGKKALIQFFEGLGNCTVIGEVEDVSMEITKYQFYLALMKSGAGIKNKVLEAMASEMVVLVNDRAIEGLAQKEELLRAVYLINRPEDITSAMADLPKWIDRSRNGRIYVQDYYTWQRYMQKLEKAYKTSIR